MSVDFLRKNETDLYYMILSYYIVLKCIISHMALLRIPAAAEQLGISHPTLKQWIYRRQIRSVKTPGGHHRIPQEEVDRLLFGGSGKSARRPTSKPTRPSADSLEYRVSGRNRLVGRVVGVEQEGLLAKITLDVSGQRVTSIITREACRDLGLRVGQVAAALIKATEVMIIRAPETMQKRKRR